MSIASDDNHIGLTERPLCPQCGHPTALSRIEPHEPGHDRRIFACVNGHEHSIVVKFK